MNIFDSLEAQHRFENNYWKINDDIQKNFIEINNNEYFLYHLDPTIKGNKGGNSIVFALYDAQSYDEDEENIPISAIKISNKEYRIRGGVIELSKKNKRFENEVNALYYCQSKKCRNVIDIEVAGKILNKNTGNYHPFYIMEYADSDLKKFIETEELNINEKVKLCLRISQGLKELDEMQFYHRDLKPDNIFIINGDWKIGDLGLIESRELDSLDDVNEFIGPRGWISPEVMNKYLTEDKGFTHKFDCKIDHQSDIFQLGKVFWYIFQGNAPIGCIDTKDFVEKDSDIYSLLRTMLNHSKKKRFKNIDEVILTLQRINKKMY